jgi:hypothetical protein
MELEIEKENFSEEEKIDPLELKKEAETDGKDQPPKPKKAHRSNYLLIQRYLKDPLLFDSRKFDMRCYALIIRTP